MCMCCMSRVSSGVSQVGQMWIVVVLACWILSVMLSRRSSSVWSRGRNNNREGKQKQAVAVRWPCYMARVQIRPRD